MKANANKIYVNVLEQLLNKAQCTEYGEPQAWYELENGRSIEVTLESNMIEKPKDYFYSVRLNCSNFEFDNDKFEKTCGVIAQYATTDNDVSEIKELISKVLIESEKK